MSIGSLTLNPVAHEAAVHAARLRVELSQSRQEQNEYLKNVELARVLEKRAERKRAAGKEIEPPKMSKKRLAVGEGERKEKRQKKSEPPSEKSDNGEGLQGVLSRIF